MADLPKHFFKFIRPGFKFNLSIPRSFWTNLKGVQCTTSILRRGRRQWLVEISEAGVFGDGWTELVSDNGVQEFDFIVFKHQGNMVFDFMVFDQTSYERQYPNLCDEINVEEPISQSDPIYKGPEKLKKHKRDNSAVRDDNFFVSRMTRFVIRKSRLHVPIKFARSNGLSTKRTDTQIVLMDEAQRSWPARLRICKNEIAITGWRKLSKNEHLKVGDECMLELVRQGEVPVFNFSRLKKLKKHKRDKSAVQNEDNFQVRDDNFQGRDDNFFVSKMTTYIIRSSRLYVPIKFARSNGFSTKRTDTQIVLMDKAQRSWPATLKICKSEIVITGWHKLSKNEHLKVGDECMFELVRQGEVPVFNFSRKVSSSNEEDDLPYFIGEVKSYSIRSSIMYLPNEFARRNGLINNEEMILRNVKDERSWSAKLNNYKNRYCYIGQGWKEFRVASFLKEGDRFKLELVNNGEKPIANFYF